jgi:ABC-type branched-subunit amino acid transport system ATPase component/branched-subunit amino acid ABC-type transport system permease component
MPWRARRGAAGEWVVGVTEAIQFAFLGFGLSAVYALLAQGIVLIYRGSGVLNFAHGAVALTGAYVYYELHKRGLPFLPATLGAMVVGAALGVLIHVLIMRPLRDSSPLTRVIATLGVLIIIQAAATLHYSDAVLVVNSPLPQNLMNVGGAAFPEDRIWLLGIAAVLTAALWLLTRFTRAGLATLAVAENESAAAALGWSPDLLAAGTWALGSALAALAGVLVVPLTGLQVDTVVLLVIPALAAALIGRFSSFPLTLVGAVFLGIGQSELTRWISSPGWPNALPLLAIVAILVVRGRGLPLRSHVLERLPNLGTGRPDPRTVAALFALMTVLCFTVFGENTLHMVISSFAVGLILLSVVVLTGYAGQLSLAQYALAGLGALAAGRLVAGAGWPFELAVPAGVIATMVAGIVFAIPALRTRGVNLAVVTLSLGLAIQQVVFSNAQYIGGSGGIQVGPQSIFGIELDAIAHPDRYAVFAMTAFTVAALAVGNLRRSRSGRRLISVRTNERGAAALGISVFGAKVYAFAFSAALAGLGGIVLSFSASTITFSEFSPINSITAVTLSVVGGVGYVIGPLFGSTLASGGLGSLITEQIDIPFNWLTLAGGVVLILLLIQDPNGMASANIQAFKALLGRLRERSPKRKAPTVEPLPRPHAMRMREGALELRGLTVRFGGVTALEGVDVAVKTGEVVGLIGPNGAGKTTLIDAATGFVKLDGGSVLIDGAGAERWSVHRRARAGLGRSFQSLELFDDVTIRENLYAASDSRAARDYLTDWLWPRRPELPSAAIDAIQRFGLEPDLDRMPGELSNGRRRLVAIARAVAAQTPILMLDEPAAGLDDTETRELAELVRWLATERGFGILLIEHDMSLVMEVSDRVVALDFGRKISEGTPSQVRRDPNVIATYLGTPSGSVAETTS